MTADSGAPRAGSDKSAAGRPRDARIDAAIIAATRELLLESGYAALTLSAIAARAGTTTAALYRRWSGKAQLVHEAVLQIDPHPVPHQPKVMLPVLALGVSPIIMTSTEKCLLLL